MFAVKIVEMAKFSFSSADRPSHSIIRHLLFTVTSQSQLDASICSTHDHGVSAMPPEEGQVLRR